MAEVIDFEAVKQGQQKVWAAGDFSIVANTVMYAAENLVEAADVRPDERVLDVACGSGNATLAAARRLGQCVGLDYVPALLDRGRERAAAERLSVEFVEGDAEALPFEDASFDVVLSIYGVMFAPDQPRAASELLRVCKPGGRIALANWTPEGAVGDMFRATTEHAPPPFKLEHPPVAWGTEERLRELLGDGVSSLDINRRMCVFRYRSADDFIEFFRTYFGPVKTAFERLDEDGQAAYAEALKDNMRRRDRGEGRGLIIDGEYLEVIATRA